MWIPTLVLPTDEMRLSDPLPVVARLPPGSAVLLRHYAAPDRRELATALARLCRQKRLTLLVAGDAALAAALGASGLHAAEGRYAILRRWRRRRPRWLLSAAAHSLRALHAAAKAGADFATLSPVFPTVSHPGARCLGSLHFAAWARRSPLPVVALGGIDDANVGRLQMIRRLAGIAAIGALSAELLPPARGPAQ